MRVPSSSSSPQQSSPSPAPLAPDANAPTPPKSGLRTGASHDAGVLAMKYSGSRSSTHFLSHALAPARVASSPSSASFTLRLAQSPARSGSTRNAVLYRASRPFLGRRWATSAGLKTTLVITAYLTPDTRKASSSASSLLLAPILPLIPSRSLALNRLPIPMRLRTDTTPLAASLTGGLSTNSARQILSACSFFPSAKNSLGPHLPPTCKYSLTR
mmetsp:Transcript_7099/g.13918  ORF Transcript_7099/g.13918 Transcript_7099/m.13918 type:complete len:215 (-) Transcript_7099:740-1384(-)